MTEQRQSVVDVVRSYHEGIARELAAVRADVDGSLADGDTADVGASIERIVIQIVGVLVAEEQYVFPAARDHVDGADAAISAQLERHRDLESDLRRLEDLELSADLVAPVLDDVIARWRDLTVVVQDVLLPPVAAALPADRSADLGDDVLGAIEVAPTRPRDVVVRSPELNKVVSFAEGWIDRWRDSWSQRGRGTDDVDDVTV
ncbi:hemerythrin domain-containing protein [Jatrophihabitans sp. YIM 134969]